jgi:hypothetical protein
MLQRDSGSIVSRGYDFKNLGAIRARLLKEGRKKHAAATGNKQKLKAGRENTEHTAGAKKIKLQQEKEKEKEKGKGGGGGKGKRKRARATQREGTGGRGRERERERTRESERERTRGRYSKESRINSSRASTGTPRQWRQRQ